MPKKGENIYKRKDGRWEGRYIKARSPEGKAIYGSVYGRKYTEVKVKLIPLKSLYEANKYCIKNFNGTLTDWLGYWLEEIARTNIKPSTYASYRGVIHRYLMQHLGKMQLHKINSDDVERFIRDLKVRGLSPGTIQSIYRILNSALTQAVYAHAILTNPCKNVPLPKSEKSCVSALTNAEQRALEAISMDEDNGIPVMLALYTGMRMGEICALKWENVDFDEGVIRVVETVLRIPCYDGSLKKTEIIFCPPKSERSSRLIPMSDNLSAYLRSYKELTKCEFVVTCKNSFAEPRVVSYRFHRLLKKAGLRPIHFHALRHTFATRCMELNIDITTLSRLLGHASVKMTLDIYTDSMLEQKAAAMAKLGLQFAEFRPVTA